MKRTFEYDLDRLREVLRKNSNTPMFARFADALGKKGLINDAIRICEFGIKKNKFYSTAYIVLAKLYLMKGEKELALKNLNKAKNLSPFCPAVKLMIEKIQKNNKITVGNKKDLKKTQMETLSDSKSSQSDSTSNEIEAIIEKLNKAESLIIKPDPNFDKFYEQPKVNVEIITETMYHIYVNQGHFREAYKVLLKLMDKYPNRLPYYQNQLEWLRKHLSEI